MYISRADLPSCESELEKNTLSFFDSRIILSTRIKIVRRFSQTAVLEPQI